MMITMKQYFRDVPCINKCGVHRQRTNIMCQYCGELKFLIDLPTKRRNLRMTAIEPFELHIVLRHIESKGEFFSKKKDQKILAEMKEKAEELQLLRTKCDYGCGDTKDKRSSICKSCGIIKITLEDMENLVFPGNLKDWKPSTIHWLLDIIESKRKSYVKKPIKDVGKVWEAAYLIYLELSRVAGN